jgi:hypothetical protein
MVGVGGEGGGEGGGAVVRAFWNISSSLVTTGSGEGGVGKRGRSGGGATIISTVGVLSSAWSPSSVSIHS